MTQITANGISIEYDTFGSPTDEPLLLVMGLGAQMTRWRPEFCEQLASAGHYVIRFDNRDVGLSQKFNAAGAPDLAKMFAESQAGKPISAAYDLNDMADDAVGLMDALKIERAHICGASLGGMIVQAMAIKHPTRVRSMTSIMSTTGDPSLPPAKPEAAAALMSPAGNTIDEVLDRAVRNSKITGSPAYRDDEAAIRARARTDFERSFYPIGTARQMAAAAASGNRRPWLEKIAVPTLVIHGKEDPLIPVTGGIDTHEAIKGSVLKVFEGMGHDLPEPLWPDIVAAIRVHTSQHH